MKNVKIKVETDEQNLKVQERLCELNDRFAWYVYLGSGIDDYIHQVIDDFNRAVCSRGKHYRFLVIDNDLDLVICMSEDIWKQREEKEVSFEAFMR